MSPVDASSSRFRMSYSPQSPATDDTSRRPQALGAERRATPQRDDPSGGLSESQPERRGSRDSARKAWVAPKLETLELASTEGGRKPSNKENGAKFVTS